MKLKIYSTIPVVVAGILPPNINLPKVLKKIEEMVPFYFVRNILDVIYVGQFPEFAERDINAFYKDGALFITNEQSNEWDFLDDILHEMGHSLEMTLPSLAYTNELESEYIQKKLVLKKVLAEDGVKVPEAFMSLQFSQEVDDFLYKELGYEFLTAYTWRDWLDEYSVTSISEYFATGFEKWIIGDSMVEKVCPALVRAFERLEISLKEYYKG